MKSLKAFVTLALLGVIVSAKQNPAVRRMDVEARHRDIALEKRAPAPQGGGLGNAISQLVGDGNNNTSTEAQTTSQDSQTTPTRGPGDGPTVITTTTTTTPVQDTPTSTPSSTPVQQTTTSTTPTTTTRAATTTQAAGTTQSRLSADTYGGTTLYANTGALSNLRASQTVTDEAAATSAASTGGKSFMDNSSAKAAVFTILGIVTAGALVFVGFWFYKKSNRGKMGEEDMWDEASMKEFHGPPPGTAIVAPPSAVLSDDYVPGLARKNTVLPSQSAGAAGGITRTRTTSSNRRDIVPDEEPDEMLALPPVKNYDRPRDSAYDIVPAAPPVAGYASQGGYGQPGYGQGYAGYGNTYASSSGAAASSSAGPSSFNPPARKGDHTSFGSGLGNDPFAGTGFTDATRESSFGPGQAGRGAGYNMNGGPGSSSHGHDGQVGMGNQWPQGYNPYHGYAQGSQQPYGGNGYGGNGYGGYAQ